MSSHYTTEPPATASATLNTTFGPLQIALFANQTPLTCRNFLQHCKDNYYAGTIFHRIEPDFIIQGGDPTGTGSGGTAIYEDREFEYDQDARDPNEKVVLRDELHSRLRFNRRGLVGMAKSEDGTYGSQFFITLANTERELNGQCTLFGRIEGDSIYNVVKIAEAERVEGTDRPVYPVKVTSCEVGELGPLEGKIKARQITATATAKTDDKPAPKKKKKAPKGGKTLLSFGDDEGDVDMPVRPAKPKYNAALVTDTNPPTTNESSKPAQATKQPQSAPTQTRKRPRSPSPQPERKERVKTPEPAAQLPLPDPESPDRSPSRSRSESPSEAEKEKPTKLSRTNAAIEDLKASMRRNVHTGPSDGGRKKSALEAMIPETAIRGRKRGAANGSRSNANGLTGFSSSAEADTLKIFNAFKAKLENADSTPSNTQPPSNTHASSSSSHPKPDSSAQQPDDEEAQLCDLHFIANCQSCQSWDTEAGAEDATGAAAAAADDDKGWLTHELRFGKDMLGKDLNWKREHPDDADSLMVIDPREREKEFAGGRKKGLQRDRERERKREQAGNLEWDKGRK
ncbi:putative peptidyl-prolyl cis-trans isomerase [Aspergillus steynii IBT 23096]|uniref:Peptidyl-prolyl isomerase CWC27 n=1 Tax=Aspergillus steynii IBT 23096 TaxID=1392250 RepID=A0A2I2GH06_9EURO|nr:putative peptidyl-prolyl cis-trans isomerase [Aspergillus steynii IBT 23096]PLB52160.1 putative peptidyl-prolyl cis-trans isomerase [Aspergillus steynii IBT 23096]